jgi:cobaltochelatase CobS
MMNGLVLILDEYDSARPETLFVLQKILEKDGRLFLFEENKEIVPHPNFRIFATANTIGDGDEAGYYSGTQIINQSNLDRWDIIAKTSYPQEQVEVKMIMSYFSNLFSKHPGLELKIVSLANLVRNAFVNSDLSVTFSIRTTMSFCKNIEIFEDFDDYKTAFELSYLNRLSDQSEIVCAKELFERCFG